MEWEEALLKTWGGAIPSHPACVHNLVSIGFLVRRKERRRLLRIVPAPIIQLRRARIAVPGGLLPTFSSWARHHGGNSTPGNLPPSPLTVNLF